MYYKISEWISIFTTTSATLKAFFPFWPDLFTPHNTKAMQYSPSVRFQINKEIWGQSKLQWSFLWVPDNLVSITSADLTFYTNGQLGLWLLKIKNAGQWVMSQCSSTCYSLSFMLCFIKFIINGLLKQIYSKDINLACHLFTCVNERKNHQCSKQKERMKNKEKPVNHFLSASAPPEFCNNESGGDTTITGKYCITDKLHAAFQMESPNSEELDWPLLNMQMFKYLSARNVQLIYSRLFLVCLAFMCCCVVLNDSTFTVLVHILMAEELSTAKTEGGFTQGNRCFFQNAVNMDSGWLLLKEAKLREGG